MKTDPARDRAARERLQAGQARATSYDVARLAGVSQSAVSRAFSGAGVADATRERVMTAARSLGYRPNAIARSLVTRRSNLVGLILPSALTLYYPEATVELTAAVSRRGARALLMTLEGPDEVKPALEEIRSYQVDGVITNAPLTTAQLRNLEEHRIPVVFYNRSPPVRAASSVLVDHAESEARLVERLWAAGHRRYGLIVGPADSEVAQERARGALERLSALGAEKITTVGGDYRYVSGMQAFDGLLKQGMPDVVLCANDAMAIGAMDSARLTHGLSIPRDLSITGFDGYGAAAWLSYQLTTVRQPIRRMAAAAADLLFARIEDWDTGPERRLLLGELVPGCSARLGEDPDQVRA